MKFLNATTDIAFKKLFGSQERSSLTISFLNSILEREEGELITHITINDTANHPETIGKKVSYVDISCTDQSDKKYIIEMQIMDEKDFSSRAQYYTAFHISRQLNSKEKYYPTLVQVIFVGIVCFDLFETPYYLTHHLITETKTNIQFLTLSEYHFIELKKFNKQQESLTTNTDKWVYLIKYAEELKQIPKQMQNSHEMTEAFHVLEQMNWSESEFMAYQTEVDLWRRQHYNTQALKEESIAKGQAEGLAEGIKKKAYEVALALLDEEEKIEKIMRITGLTRNEILNLKK